MIRVGTEDRALRAQRMPLGQLILPPLCMRRQTPHRPPLAIGLDKRRGRCALFGPAATRREGKVERTEAVRLRLPRWSQTDNRLNDWGGRKGGHQGRSSIGKICRDEVVSELPSPVAPSLVRKCDTRNCRKGQDTSLHLDGAFRATPTSTTLRVCCQSPASRLFASLRA